MFHVSAVDDSLGLPFITFFTDPTREAVLAACSTHEGHANKTVRGKLVMFVVLGVELQRQRYVHLVSP